MALVAEPRASVADPLEQGAPAVCSHLLPVSAMCACTGAACSLGDGPSHENTGCPSNPRKPKRVTWIRPNTVNTPGEASRPAPFCKTGTLAEAADDWCAGIVNWRAGRTASAS